MGVRGNPRRSQPIPWGVLLYIQMPMNTTTLLEKLFDIERALQRENYSAARSLVMQAEEFILQTEREMIHAQTEKLRQAA